MNQFVEKYSKFFYFFENVRSDYLGFSFSFFLHFALLLFAIGIPNFFDPKPIYIPTIIPIEIINVSEITSIPKEVKDIKPSESKQVQIKEKKFNSSETQEIKKIELKPKPKPEPKFDIASMLKDLRNEKTTPKVDNINEEEKKDIIKKETQEVVEEKGAELSISEIDLVLQQLSRCFIAPAGAEIKKSMYVKISAKIQRNRRVLENSIRIVDTNISKSSTVYGPITESAMRTLLNPDCIPLKLPEDKYEVWKNLTMKFDYSIMRGN